MDGWYRLPRSGHPFYGPVPDGAEMLDGPPAGDTSAFDEFGQQDVDALEGGGTVGSEVPGVDLDADAHQVGPGEGDGTGEDAGDDLGHEGEA